MREEFLWVEKYRPKTVDDTILPDNIKDMFKEYVKTRQIPNMILVGGAGTGKTTVVRAMLEEIDCDYIVINASLSGGIETLRNDMQRFASAVSFSGGRKYIVLDEADNTTQATQLALRAFIEEYSSNCGFILTCNFLNRIIAPIHSRCTPIDFKINKNDLPVLASQFLKRCMTILDTEGVTYDKAVVVEIIKKFYPDWRRVIGELQGFSAGGTIDVGALSVLDNTGLKELMGFLKNKEFTKARGWVAQSHSNDTASLYRSIYDTASTYVDKSTVPALVLILAKYQYQDSFVADHELNTIACLTEIMMECQFL